MPSLYEPYVAVDSSVEDEWTLCAHLGDRAREVMEKHYRTFITEEDFAAIASAGLNWVRIPLGYWAVAPVPDDAYVGHVSWTYFLKAVVWARKYGLRVLLDVHALPGSQNGWNHSGRGNGTVNFMQGAGGIVNAQRALNVLRSLAQFVTQPGIRDVVPVLGLVNEVRAFATGAAPLGAFYHEAYRVIREATGTGAGHGPFLAIHEGFVTPGQWAGFMPGADRVIVDHHPYKAFTPEHYGKTWPEHVADVCDVWGRWTGDSNRAFGLTIGGEWSLATTDCGKWLNAVGRGAAFPDCAPHEDWRTFGADMKQGLHDLFTGTADALQNWFFWTWKIANSTTEGYAPSPAWHYRLGWEQGWIPRDPRSAEGFCASRGLCAGCHFTGTYPPAATGGDPSPTVRPGSFEQAHGEYMVFPPAVFNYRDNSPMNAASRALVPTLTPTGAPVTLPMPIEYRTVSGAGNGWANPADQAPAYVEVAGCSYGAPYDIDAFWSEPCAGGSSADSPSAIPVAASLTATPPVTAAPVVTAGPSVTAAPSVAVPPSVTGAPDVTADSDITVESMSITEPVGEISAEAAVSSSVAEIAVTIAEAKAVTASAA